MDKSDGKTSSISIEERKNLKARILIAEDKSLDRSILKVLFHDTLKYSADEV